MYALIFYDNKQRKFRLSAFGDLLVNGLKVPKLSVGGVLSGELLNGRTPVVGGSGLSNFRRKECGAR